MPQIRNWANNGEAIATSTNERASHSSWGDSDPRAFARASRPRAPSPPSLTVPLSFAELTELNLALEMSRSEIEAARDEVLAVTADNAELQRSLRTLHEELAEAKRLACHDALTGLPNRILLGDRLEHAIALAKRNSNQIIVLVLDVNRFKEVNDRYGHAVGDAILQQVGARLTGVIRASDTACRYGGDEFVVVFPDIVDYENGFRAVQKVFSALTGPYVIGTHSHVVTTSIGLAVYPDDGATGSDLIACADRTMYQEKSGADGSDQPLAPSSEAVEALFRRRTR